jgi:hypothetical protein
MAPEVSEPRAIAIELRAGEESLAAGELTIIPQRKWRVFVVHHSHLDIGYTDPQGTVLRHHLEYLDGALALARQTDGWPDDARFRWTVESSLPALRLERERGRGVHRAHPPGPDRGDRVPVPAAYRGVLGGGARAGAQVHLGAA